ncbi:uncharacterized protein LOC106168159 [Lingula anatina]|uniref:Uncharacterized protein LOC106168159 n=1 Tax=Lingula anatina TaxID=7574 RepID=A0A1S3IX83_LINAN|nr:uncharacterized protein LOC106168159 [Lingula anatina]|eukprot:XP_013402571.2 uncharacterized protein LOC106168159 [Lingula anatina]
MPRFLAIDYLTEAVQKKKAVLNAQLPATLPLEKIGGCLHGEVLEEDAHRKPWRRVSCESAMSAVTDHGGLVTDIKVSEAVKPVKYYSPVVVVKKDLDCIEIVPSSNPQSPSWTQEYKELSKRLGNGEETFVPDLESDSEFSLEEVFVEDTIVETRGQAPRVPDLLGRLQPPKVKDPCTDEDGVLYTEESVFGSDRHYTSSVEMPPKPKVIKEIFKVAEVLPDFCPTAEEDLEPARGSSVMDVDEPAHDNSVMPEKTWKNSFISELAQDNSVISEPAQDNCE